MPKPRLFGADQAAHLDEFDALNLRIDQQIEELRQLLSPT